MLAGLKCANLPGQRAVLRKRTGGKGISPPPLYVGHKLGKWVGNERKRAAIDMTPESKIWS